MSHIHEARSSLGLGWVPIVDTSLPPSLLCPVETFVKEGLLGRAFLCPPQEALSYSNPGPLGTRVQ